MYDENMNFIPTDGRDYKLMTDKELEKEVEEIENLENPVEGDGLDEIVIGDE